MAKTVVIFKLPPGKIPHRLQKFVKTGGKVFECEWCGTYNKQEFCNPGHESLFKAVMEGD